MSARHLRRARAVADDYSFSNHGLLGGDKNVRLFPGLFDPLTDLGTTYLQLRRQSLSLDSIPDAIIRQIHSARSTSNSPRESCSPHMRDMVAQAARERAMTYSISPRVSLHNRPLFRNRTMDGPGISITVSEPENVDRLVKRTQSDSVAMVRAHDPVKDRSRSVNFFGDVEDNCDKKRLQRTPTPYWSRKEMGDDASADEDGIDYTPNYDPPDWDEGSGSSSLTAPKYHRPSTPGEDTSSSLESLSQSSAPPTQGACAQIDQREANIVNFSVPEKSRSRSPEVCKVVSQSAPEVPPTDNELSSLPELYRNPLFRKVQGYSMELSEPAD